ncbi:MAG: hypothetical protein K9I71_08225 [Ignavibacteriales bacterium]|nr:hypothetical protein [Ignavibacteriales bacterium]MCF8316097.1 hypothetical protein [Ignavibacteriales bacterium]MCF8436599.1 hypothetical protein [Ignavibacteriales bacterium]
MRFNRIKIFLMVLLIVVESYGQQTGDYRSNTASGDWTSNSSWQTWNGTSWVAAGSYPNDATKSVTILTGHQIKPTANVSCKDFSVSGRIYSYQTSYTISVYGNITWNGSTSYFPGQSAIFKIAVEGPSCTIGGSNVYQFDVGSIRKNTSTNSTTDVTINRNINFVHNTKNIYNISNGILNVTIAFGTINANYGTSSGINLDGSGDSPGGSESGGTLTVWGTLNASNIILNNNNSSAQTKLEIKGTVNCSEFFNWSASSANSTLLIESNKSFTVPWNTLYDPTNNILDAKTNSTIIHSNSELFTGAYHNLTINQIGGNIALNGNVTVNGNFTLSGSAGFTANGYSISYGENSALIYNYSRTTSIEWNDAINIPVTINSNKIVTLNAGKTINSSNLTVNGTLMCAEFEISGTGNFYLNSGASLGVGAENGITESAASGNIQVSGVRSYSSSANYIYNRDGIQYTGDGLPTTVNNFTLQDKDNSGYSTVFLTDNLTVNGSYIRKSGIINKNGKTLSYGPDAILSYENGNSGISPSDEWPDPLNADLSFTNTAAVVADGKTVNGDVTLNNNSRLHNGSTITINGSLTVETGAKISAQSDWQILIINGSSFTNNGTVETGKLQFTGIGQQTISGLTGVTFGSPGILIGNEANAVVNSAEIVNFPGGRFISIEDGGLLTINGTLTLNNGYINCLSALEIGESGILTINNAGINNYNTPITGGGTIVTTGSSYLRSPQGDRLTDSSVDINVQSGTCAFDRGDPNQSIIGGLLTIDEGATFAMLSWLNLTLEGGLILNGTLSGDVGTQLTDKSSSMTINGTLSVNQINFARSGTQSVTGLRNISPCDIKVKDGTNLVVNNTDTLTIGTSQSMTIESGATLTVNGDLVIYGLEGCSSIGNQRCGLFTKNGQLTVNNKLWLCLGTVELYGTPVNGSGLFQVGQEQSNNCDLTNFIVSDITASETTFEVPAGCAVGIGDLDIVTHGPAIISGSFVMKCCVSQPYLGTATFYNSLTMNGGRFCGIWLGCDECNGANVYVRGDFSNPIGDPVSVVLEGTSLQHIEGNFSDITINNPAGIELLGDVNISGTLQLESGIVNTGENILTIGTGIGNRGSLNYFGGRVIGKVKRWFAAQTVDNILFPTGTDNFYRPVNISFTGAPGNGGTLTVQFIDMDPGDSGLPLSAGDTTVTNCSQDGYWQIEEGNSLSGGTYKIDLTASGFGGVSDYQTLRILKRENSSSDWSLSGYHLTTTGSNSTPTLHRGGLTGFSEFGVGGGEDNPLPLELNFFNCTNINRDVTLNWQTITEFNTAVFEIERCSSGNNSVVEQWVKIAEKMAAGTSNSLKNYIYFDENLNSGLYMYRLKMLDNDGSYTYSSIVETEIENPKDFAVSQNYPNPFNPATSIDFQVPTKCRVSLNIFSASGELISRINESEYYPGYYTITINPGNISSGVYFCQILFSDSEGTNYSTIKKLIYMK